MSSPTSVPAVLVSSGSEKGFWVESLKDEYRSFVLPTRTASLGLPLSYSSGSLQPAAPHWWLRTQTWRVPETMSQPFLWRTYSPSFTSTTADSKAVEKPKKGGTAKRKHPEPSPEDKPKKQRPGQRLKPVLGLVRSRQLLLRPTEDQSDELMAWINAARWVYNQCVADIKWKRRGDKVEWMALRNRYATNNDKTPEWLRGIPKTVREQACKEAAQAFHTGISNLKKGSIGHFDLSFRSKKKMKSQSVTVPKSSVKYDMSSLPLSVKLYPSRIKDEICIKDKHDTVIGALADLDFDVKVVYKQMERRMYLCVPIERTKPTPKVENQDPGTLRFVALDPGVRTFMTFYSPSGVWGKICDNDFKRIERLLVWMDDLQSRIDVATVARKRRDEDCFSRHKLYRMRRAWKRMIVRVRNLISEAHWKVANYLTDNFDVIYIPTFETSQMTHRQRRKIRSKTARNMLTWRHYDFRQKLITKAEEKAVKVIECTEEYTSKTCGNCGFIKNNLGGSKMYRCDRCNISLDRDLNGARNIFLKNHCLQRQ